ncbi:8024_t:CDS:2, partial [Ambispora leptoticha]
EQVSLTEEEEVTLQRILNESFNTSQPDFDTRKAIENLRKNFEGKVALCQECLFAKQCTELEMNQGLCDECYQEQNKPNLLEEQNIEETHHDDIITLEQPEINEKLPEDLEDLEELPTETEALQQALQANALKHNFVYTIDTLIPYKEYILEKTDTVNVEPFTRD